MGEPRGVCYLLLRKLHLQRKSNWWLVTSTVFFTRKPNDEDSHHVDSSLHTPCICPVNNGNDHDAKYFFCGGGCVLWQRKLRVDARSVWYGLGPTDPKISCTPSVFTQQYQAVRRRGIGKYHYSKWHLPRYAKRMVVETSFYLRAEACDCSAFMFHFFEWLACLTDSKRRYFAIPRML